MYRTFRGDGAAVGLRLPEPEAALGRLRAMARWLLLAALAFALGRAAALGGHAPFALALLAAAVVSGRHMAPLLAGCALSGFRSTLAETNLGLLAGCAVALGGDLAWSAAGPLLGRLRAALRRAPAIQARSPNRERMVRAAALAGAGVLAPGLVAARGEVWASAQATAAALAAVAAAPFMVDVLALTPRRRFLLAEERLGLALLCCAAAAGLYALWPPLALCLSTAALLAAGRAGAALGAGLGGALLLMSGDAGSALVLCLTGAAAQLCGGIPEGARTGAAASLGLLAGLVAGLPPLSLAGLAAGAPLPLLLPSGLRRRVDAWLRPPSEGCDPERLAGYVRARSAARIRAMGEAFGALAEGYLVPEALPDGQALLGQLRGLLCAGCPSFDSCWAGESNRAARLLCDLAGMAARWSEAVGGALFEEGVPPDIARRCRRSRLIPERLGGPLEDFARRRQGALRRGGENRLISAQFLQARELLEGLAAEQARPLRLRERQAARAASALERAGIGLSDAMLLAGRRTSLVLTLREGLWTPELADRAAAALRGAFGRGYAPEGAGGRTLCFTRLPRLRAAIGVAGVPREAGAPSGDSSLAMVLDGDRLLAVICDGMGSGEAACRESASAVRLLGRFLSAGAAWPLAVETVNALMLNAGTDDMFSTMDLLLLDLSTGMAEFVKLAACPALVARDGALERIEGGRLPLGILDRVHPAATRMQLMPGDVVFMASDGVMDAADPDALEALLLDAAAARPCEGEMNALAQRALRLAGDGLSRDDMTVICVRVARQ